MSNKADNELKLKSLVRIASDRLFLFRFINGTICYPQLLELINLYAPIRPLWSTQPFLAYRYCSNFSILYPVNRICNVANICGNALDIFYDFINTSKSRIYRILQVMLAGHVSPSILFFSSSLIFLCLLHLLFLTFSFYFLLLNWRSLYTLHWLLGYTTGDSFPYIYEVNKYNKI